MDAGTFSALLKPRFACASISRASKPDSSPTKRWGRCFHPSRTLNTEGKLAQRR